MNVYHSFFMAITPEEWEFFSIDFLNAIGYEILRRPSRGPDGGRDALVRRNGRVYLVSCKHLLESNRAVGLSDEPAILDRVTENDAQGFIGVYSTLVSTPLDNRFLALTRSGTECFAFDGNSICNHLPSMPSYILQKYGLPNNVQYVLNVTEFDYRPLQCMQCEKDILLPENIRLSLAAIVQSLDGIEYVYGCKDCLGRIHDLAWTEVYQVLHQEQLILWNDCVSNFVSSYPVSANFYKNKSDFESAIHQRMYPSNWGRWLT